MSTKTVLIILLGRLICLIIRELRICEKFEIVRNQILSNIIGMHFHMMQLKRLN